MAGGSSEAVKCPRAVRPRCLPKPRRVLKGAVKCPRGSKTPLPSDVFSRGLCGLRKWRTWAVASTPNHQEDDDDDKDDAAVTMDVDSISEAEDQGSPIVSAGAQGGTFPLNASSSGSTLLHRTLGSSRASGVATSTTTVCNTNTASTTITSPSLPSHNLVFTQPTEGEERDVGRGEASTSQRQPQRAALRQ